MESKIKTKRGKKFNSLIDLESRKKRKKIEGLNVFCPKCNKNIHEDNILSCPHHHLQAYRVAIRDPYTSEVKSKILKTKLYDIAVKETLDFKSDLKKHRIQIIHKKEEVPTNLIDAINMYTDYLYNKGIPEHLQRIRTQKHIKEQNRYLNRFLEFLNDTKYMVKRLTIHDITDEIVGKYYTFLQSFNYRPSTFNHNIKALKFFYNFMIDNKGVNIRNPFNKVKLRKCKSNPVTTNKSEFETLLSVITPANGIQKYSSDKERNHYFNWSKPSLKIAVFSGRRGEELTNMKFSNIVEKEDGSMIIVGIDYKANKLSNITEDENKKRFVVPVGDELKQVLLDLGYEKYKNTERYLIAPDCTRRKNLHKRISRMFTHFWRLTGIKKKLSLYSLRRTHITALEIATKGNAYLISGQSSNQLVQDHYINHKEIASELSIQGFSIF